MIFYTQHNHNKQYAAGIKDKTLKCKWQIRQYRDEGQAGPDVQL